MNVNGGVPSFTCGHSSDENDATANHASSPRQKSTDAPGAEDENGRDSPAPPWMGHGARGKRSARLRSKNNSFTKRFAAELKQVGDEPREGTEKTTEATEQTRQLAAPVPRRPPAAFVAGTEIGVPSDRSDAATPPAHLRVTNTTAAELLVGSPGAGMAAADTLLMLLMTAGADADDANQTAKPAVRATGTTTGVTCKRPTTTSVSGLKPRKKASMKREKELVDASNAKRLKTASLVTRPKTKADYDSIPITYAQPALYHGPDVVPDTAMYNAASAAAAKRRLLPSRGGGWQKVHRPWTHPEVVALVRGVAHYGRGQWADIKSLSLHGVSAALESRSAVDLKDKWRNLLRIAMLPVLYKRREATEVPPELLQRVRELAAAKNGNGGGGAIEGALNVSGDKGDSPSSHTQQASALKGARRSKHHSPWTLTESEALVDGVAKCAGCRWTVIKKLGLTDLERRTAMDLKDKWRNLLQLASLPSQSRRKAETPPELLQRVLRLEAKFGVARRKGRKVNDDA